MLEYDEKTIIRLNNSKTKTFDKLRLISRYIDEVNGFKIEPYFWEDKFEGMPENQRVFYKMWLWLCYCELEDFAKPISEFDVVYGAKRQVELENFLASSSDENESFQEFYHTDKGAGKILLEWGLQHLKSNFRSMKIFKITDDSGFLGLANYDKYLAFIGENWDFEVIKERIIEQMNAHNLLFWATGMENDWKVSVSEKASERIAFREERAVIEVTSRKLFLTKYETLTMAAAGYTKLPEKHLEDLYVDLENGKYMIKFRQMANPNLPRMSKDYADFEIVIQKMRLFI